MGLFSKIFDDILGFDPPKAPPLPPLPPPPVSKENVGAAGDEIRKRQRARQSGRRQTIVTGDLTPETPGRTNLLGRPA